MSNELPDFKKIKLPLLRQAYPEAIAEQLAIPDPGIWEGVIKHYEEVASMDLSNEERKRLESIRTSPLWQMFEKLAHRKYGDKDA